jgi:hypothetical protein
MAPSSVPAIPDDRSSEDAAGKPGAQTKRVARCRTLRLLFQPLESLGVALAKNAQGSLALKFGHFGPVFDPRERSVLIHDERTQMIDKLHGAAADRHRMSAGTGLLVF